MMGATFIDVIVDVPTVGDRRFTYTCPEEISLPRGAKVRVPFGRSMADGYVVERAPEVPSIQVKSIEDVYDLDFLPPPHLLKLGCDLASYYCASTASFWSCLWSAVAPRKSLARLLKDGGARGGAAPAGHMGGKAAADPVQEPAAGLASGLDRVPVDLVWGDPSFRWKVYVTEIRKALSLGKGVLFLAPEIKGLGYAVERLSSQFPGETCLVHSEMTGLLRRGAWLSLARGEKKIAVGTRSAVFAPVHDLGLVILDDEPSSAHKSLDWPFYDARTIALWRSFEGAKVVFGAFHPSVDAFWNSQSGRWTCLRDQEEAAATAAGIREAVVLDLRDSRPSRDIISEPLQEELKKAFQASKRAVLFLNRRGDSSQVSCQDCGNAILCPRCGVPLSHHAKEGQMVCHTCGLRQEAPSVCPSCGGHKWRMSGYGIERAETEFRRKFPEVPVFRLDHDAAKETPLAETLRAFGEASPSCLVATQMVLGFPLSSSIGVVGVLSADTALSVPDFRASEKAYQLLARLGDLVAPGEGFPGTYVIQTRNPDHHAIKGIVDGYEFYEVELQNRRMLGYPPFKRFFKIRFGGRNFERVRDTASDFASRALADGSVRVLGPVPAPKPKVRGQYWWQVALRGEDHEAMAAMCRSISAEVSRTGAVKIVVDVDPVDME